MNYLNLYNIVNERKRCSEFRRSHKHADRELDPHSLTPLQVLLFHTLFQRVVDYCMYSACNPTLNRPGMVLRNTDRDLCCIAHIWECPRERNRTDRWQCSLLHWCTDLYLDSCNNCSLVKVHLNRNRNRNLEHKFKIIRINP